MKSKYVLLLLLWLLGSLSSRAQKKVTTQGKEFYVAFMNNPLLAPPVETRLYITGLRNTTGTITNPNTGFSQTFAVTGGMVTLVSVPTIEAFNSNPGNINNLGLVVIASDTISVYAMCHEFQSSDATNVIQKEALGTEYLIATYSPLLLTGRTSGFLIEATDDNTIIEIVPSATTTAGNVSGQPFSVTLNKAQTYYVNSKSDLSGSFVRVTNGCKPIAVFSGNEVAFIPVDYGTGDHLYEQLFPISSFGKEFISATLKGRNVCRIRVYAAYNNTNIAIDGTTVTNINKGQWYEFETTNVPKYIKTSNPSEVMLFAVGQDYDVLNGPATGYDPTMITISPIEQQLKDAVFLCPKIGATTFLATTVLCKTVSISSVLLDGINVSNEFSTIPGNPEYSIAALTLNSGQHRLQNSTGFIAYAYGFGDAQGYGYCVGSAVENLRTYFTCDNISSIDSPTITKCRGVITFNIIAAEANDSYTWNFGDGSAEVTTPGTVLVQTHNYLTDGLYPVTLTTTNTSTSGCQQNTSTKLSLNIVSQVSPTISIVSVPSASVCPNTMVTLLATPSNAGATPTFQWKLNNQNVGTNSANFHYTPTNGDVVKCVLTSNELCANPNTATSNEIAFDVATTNSTPTVVISVDHNPICLGQVATFTAVPKFGGSSPKFQWKVNGTNVGANSPMYTNSNLQANDVVSCEVTSNLACILTNTGISNLITIQINPSQPPSPAITITTANNPICEGEVVNFLATVTNPGTDPVFEWTINGAKVGTNSASFTSRSLKNGDRVNCTIISNVMCTNPATSQSIIMDVNPIPQVSFNPPQIVIKQGASTQLNPIITGTILQYLWSPSASLNNSAIATPIANPLESTKYLLEVESIGHCKASSQLDILVYRELLMPNAFTPNVDSKNDIFRIPKGLLMQIQNFSIYNRWGQKIFETSDINTGWDGTFKGTLQNMDAYVWVIQFTDPFTGKTVTKKGSVTLIR